jgi:hypothetical protein
VFEGVKKESKEVKMHASKTVSGVRMFHRFTTQESEVTESPY